MVQQIYFLKNLILPPGLNFLLFILGFILQFHRNYLGKILMTIALLSLILLSLPIIAYPFINLLQRQSPILSSSQIEHPKPNFAILILGGGDKIKAEYQNERSVSDATFNRLSYGAYLYNKMHLPVIVSGGPPHPDLPSLAQLMSKELMSHYQIRADYLETQSNNTADESRLILPILQQNKLTGVYLVTHAWHMPRSRYIFQCAGIQVIAAPMGHYRYGPGYSTISYLPNIDALYASTIAIHEWIGLLWYRYQYSKICKISHLV